MKQKPYNFYLPIICIVQCFFCPFNPSVQLILIPSSEAWLILTVNVDIVGFRLTNTVDIKPSKILLLPIDEVIVYDIKWPPFLDQAMTLLDTSHVAVKVLVLHC